MTVPIRSFNLL